MTTLDDTIAYALANPLESVGHCTLCDRITEEHGEAHARAAILELVVKHPENDAPRLVFAEWCERNGEEKRGEFVRVQCELASNRFENGDKSGPALKSHEMIRHKQLKARETELWSEPDPWGRLGIPQGWVVGLNHSPGNGGSRHMRVYRGFVGSVTCAAADWLAHGDAIRREQPVTLVRLATMPKMEHDPLNQDGKPFPQMWLKGRTKRMDVPLGYPIGHRHWVDRLLEFEWPGITFDIPAITYAGWDAAPNATPIDDLRSFRDRLRGMTRPLSEPL